MVDLKFTEMTTKLIQTKSLLLSNGYKDGTQYIGLQNNLWLFCNNPQHMKYANHELMVKNKDNWHYVCMECKCSVSYVD